METPEFKWNWQEFCGSDSFQIWTSNHEDLSICFQLLCLQIPILSIVAVVSAYYAGKHSGTFLRTSREKRILKFRMYVVLLLACKPIVETVVLVYNNSKSLRVIDYGLAALASFSWFVHFSYVSAMRCDSTMSLRGPMKLVSLWVMLFVASIVHTRSIFLKFQNDTSLEATTSLLSVYIVTALQILYGFSLFFSDDSDSQRSTNQEDVMRSSGYVRFREDFDQNRLGTAIKDSGFLSKLSFNWVNRLIERGTKNQILRSEDIYELPQELENPLYTGSDDAVLSRLLRREFAVEFYSIGILKLISDLAILSTPLLLNELLKFMEDTEIPTVQGYLYSGGILLAFMIGSFCAVHFNFLMGKLSIKCQAFSMVHINDRMSKVGSTHVNKPLELSQYVSREMCADVKCVANLWSSIHKLWSLSFQLVITLYLLYMQVSVASICGVLCSIPLIPISKIVDKKIGELHTQMMSKREKRVALTSTVIRNILQVKLYRLEDYFVSKIQGLRAEEVKYLQYLKFLRAVSSYFLMTAPVTISALTFTVFIYAGGTLNAVVVFTSLLLLMMLQKLLTEFPIQLGSVINSWIRMKKVDEFDQVLRSFECEDGCTEESVWAERQIMELSFTGDYLSSIPKELITSEIEHIFDVQNYHANVSIKKGQLVGIIGPASSGKSHLLNTIMDQLRETEHCVGYVSQTPWIETCCLQKNITFGQPYSENRYRSVVTACALEEDISSWPEGDYEMLGDTGRTLSDSQKAKIALARAVYADVDFYVLDDILSSVDKKLALHLFEECFVKLLAGKTRLVVLNHNKGMQWVDWVIQMNKGRIEKQGPVEDFLLYLSTHHIASTSREESHPRSNNESVNETREVSPTTDVKLGTCCEFCMTFGYVFALFFLLSAMGLQISRVALDWWLSSYVTVQTNHEANRTDLFYSTGFERALLVNDTLSDSSHQHFLTVLMVICTSNAVMAIVLSFSVAYGSTRNATKIHKELLRTIVQAKMKYLYSSPVDKIIERFTTDLYRLDTKLPYYFYNLLLARTRLIGILMIILYGIPWLCLCVIPLIPVYLRLQNQYRITSRKVEHIFKSCHSRVYSFVNGTVSGHTTIRAFGRWRTFDFGMDSLHECQLATIASQAWLNIRLCLMCVVVIGVACVVSLLQRNFDLVHVGFIGLTITYALTLHFHLEDEFVETEHDTAAIARINELVQNINSEPVGDEASSYYHLWLKFDGYISFRRVFLLYSRDLPSPLRNATFDIGRGEKIGIVGRSGAGKSSLLLSLFRLIEINSGVVFIGGEDISYGPLKKLRSRMTLFFEDTFIFDGTLYNNLDPLDLWGGEGEWGTHALVNAGFEPYIEKLGGIHRWICDEDPTLSVYDRQLIGLLRAILKYLKKNSQIVCIDVEDTNVDSELRELVRYVKERLFRGRGKTVLMTARDPKTVLDCDKVLVMDEGEVLEFDSPQSLLKNKCSHFSKMVNHDQ